MSRGASWRPPVALRPYVTQASGYCYDAGAQTGHRGMPSTTLTVVLSFGQPLDVGWYAHHETQHHFWGVVSGLSVEAAEIRQRGRQEGISFGLTPAGARLLLGLPASAVQGQLVSLDDVLGALGSRLYDVVAVAVGWRERFAALGRQLTELAAAGEDTPPARSEVAHAWSRLTGPGAAAARVAEVASDVGWSRRHLGEQFRAETGLSPTDVRRLARFERSHAMMRQLAQPLAEVAFTCGFADQAHMTREWRYLCGYTPGEWIRAELPFVQDGAANGGDADVICFDQHLKES